MRPSHPPRGLARQGPAFSKGPSDCPAETGDELVVVRSLVWGSRQPQFFALSTSLFLPIQGIMARNFSPTSSIGWALARARIALNEVWLTRFSSIQSRVNLPDWISPSTRFISAFVSGVMRRGPETYSPYSAVLEIE